METIDKIKKQISENPILLYMKGSPKFPSCGFSARAVEAMACILAVQNDIVPPTINHEEGDDDPNIDYKMNFTFNKAQKREVRAALSNTFGFGGHNACVVFKKYAE